MHQNEINCTLKKIHPMNGRTMSEEEQLYSQFEMGTDLKCNLTWCKFRMACHYRFTRQAGKDISFLHQNHPWYSYIGYAGQRQGCLYIKENHLKEALLNPTRIWYHNHNANVNAKESLFKIAILWIIHRVLSLPNSWERSLISNICSISLRKNDTWFRKMLNFLFLSPFCHILRVQEHLDDARIV
jgi:hypothetical protein